MTNLIKAADKNARLKQKTVGIALLFIAIAVAVYGVYDFTSQKQQSIIKQLNKTEQQKHDNIVKGLTSNEYKTLKPLEFN